MDWPAFNETVSSVVTTYNPRTVWAVIVAIIVLSAVLIYYVFRPRASYVTAMGPFELKGAGSAPALGDTKVPLFTSSQIESSLGNNFSINMFVYMDDVNRERIPIGGPEGDFRFKPFLTILGMGEIVLDPIHQVAQVRVKPLVKSPSTGVLEATNVHTINVPNFMISRWNALTVTVEGRTVDVYLNGALANSMLLTNVPILKPVGVLLETSPDFSGQAGLFQAWPHRLTADAVALNYKRNADLRGKPLIPEPLFDWSKFWAQFTKSLCDVGICSFYGQASNPLEYIEYEYA